MLPASLEVLDVSGTYDNPHKFNGGIPSEWGALTNLKELKMVYCGLDGKLLSIRTERFAFSRFVDKLCRAPGCDPKELAKLANLKTLRLFKNEGLQVPEGAPLHSSAGMAYESREAVAAFQACLK